MTENTICYYKQSHTFEISGSGTIGLGVYPFVLFESLVSSEPIFEGLVYNDSYFALNNVITTTIRTPVEKDLIARVRVGHQVENGEPFGDMHDAFTAKAMRDNRLSKVVRSICSSLYRDLHDGKKIAGFILRSKPESVKARLDMVNPYTNQPYATTLTPSEADFNHRKQPVFEVVSHLTVPSNFETQKLLFNLYFPQPTR